MKKLKADTIIFAMIIIIFFQQATQICQSNYSIFVKACSLTPTRSIARLQADKISSFSE